MKYVAIAAILALASFPVTTTAQNMPAGQTATAQLTATIVAIDRDARAVTLQDAKGNAQTIVVGPEIKRFDELKVGQTVTFRYQESVAYAIAKPGTAPAPAGTPTLVRGTGPNPSGTISRTVTATVTIVAIDAAAPSITVKTADGHTISMLVNDKAHLAGLKAGDVVQITYTQALAITVQ
ncbi:MAG: hypothetical protein JO029_08495 [Candidatus Eremiobacteraeota bacterium]|nr:hypothetical protein [Candidatus Eremiobacteraeota bacterium]MBV8723058.1 hypothetical protein [Candidatus Eremiobacteraeota bacterium]